MSDPMEDMLLESAAQEAAESEQRAIIMQRLTELREMIATLAKAVTVLIEMEKQERAPQSFVVDERDEYGQIKRFTIQ